MESDEERKSERKQIAPMSDIGFRAGRALDQALDSKSGRQHRDKAVARIFGVSVRMAQYLRKGQHWTLGRLSQASAVLGVSFDVALFSPQSSTEFYDELREVAERLAALEERANAEMVGRSYARSAPSQDEGSGQRGRDLPQGGAIPDRTGAVARTESAPVATQMGTARRGVDKP